MSPSFGTSFTQRRIGTPDDSIVMAHHCPLKKEPPGGDGRCLNGLMNRG